MLTKLLVVGSEILGHGVFTVTEGDIKHLSFVYPKQVIPGWQIVEATLPTDYAHDKYTFSAGMFAIKAVPVTDAEKADLSNQIDAAVLAVYERPMSFSEEYKEREQAAIAYKVANYIGEVPPRLLGFSTPAKLTPKVAADLILTQAAQMRMSLASLSDLRMRKYEVLLASTETEARSAHAEIMAAISIIATALN